MWQSLTNKMFKLLLHHSQTGRNVYNVLEDGEACMRKLEQGYNEGYVKPKSEFNHFLKHRDFVRNTLNKPSLKELKLQ